MFPKTCYRLYENLILLKLSMSRTKCGSMTTDFSYESKTVSQLSNTRLIQNNREDTKSSGNTKCLFVQFHVLFTLTDSGGDSYGTKNFPSAYRNVAIARGEHVC